MSFLCDVDTKLEAYKLVHDPTKLLTLLYLKYGDIEEDYYLLYANQVVYNKPSHFNSIFKERQINDDIDEFLKRKYKLKEIKERIPKLSDYYKNYHLFFCKPTFINFYFYKLMHTYEEQKAEIFYKNNYEDENSKNDETGKEIKQKCESSSLSSLDDITDNKIIFTKLNKKIIDNNLDSGMYTLTFTLESLKNNNSSNFGLISKRSQNVSFEKVLRNFVNYQNKKKEKKNKEKNKKKEKENEQNNMKKKNFTSYMRKRKKKVISQISYKNINSKTHNKIKNSLNTLEKRNFSSNKNKVIKAKIRKNKSHSKNNIFFSAKIDKNFFSKLSSKIEEFQKNKSHDIQNNNYNHKRNKTYRAINNQISINNKNLNINLVKNANTNSNISNFKTFSKLSKMLNNNKINILNKKKYNSINNNFNNTMKSKKTLKNNIYKNVDQFLTVNNDQINNNAENLKRKKNKTFDYIINNNNQKIIASSNVHSPSVCGVNNKVNYKIIDITKNRQKKNSYGGSKFNLVKGSIVDIIKKPQTTNIQNYNNNLLNKLSINYSSNFNHYKNNTKHFNSNNKMIFSNMSNSIHKFNLMSSKAEMMNINNHKSNNINNEKKLSHISNNNSTNYENKHLDKKCTNNDIKQKSSNKNNVSYTNNNFNINFNNVIFCSQRLSSGSPDSNYNSINNIKNNNLNANNTNNLSNNNNLTQNNNLNNNNNIIHKVNDNIYLSSLKSIYNSRNKHKMKTSSLTQNKTGNGNIKTQSKNNKNLKDKNFNSYNSNNIPLNQKKYVIKENNLVENPKNNSKKKKKLDFGHKISNQIEELIKNSHKINFQNNVNLNNNLNKEQNKGDKKEEYNQNNCFSQKDKEKKDNNKNAFSITSSLRLESANNLNKNFNLTSKNNSKVKHKKRISNYI